MTSYPRGVKENGAVFCHCNPWTIIAEAMYGNRERAFDYYTRIAPAWREDISEVHRCEPYVYAQMIAGKESPRCGEAKNSWLTGTAAWNYLAAFGYLLGIRAGYNGLVIDPALPTAELPLTVKRTFRNCRYIINIRSGSAKRLLVNGKEHPFAEPIPPCENSELHIECELPE
jgi:cellobiose phosphorylase